MLTEQEKQAAINYGKELWPDAMAVHPEVVHQFSPGVTFIRVLHTHLIRFGTHTYMDFAVVETDFDMTTTVRKANYSDFDAYNAYMEAHNVD